MNSRTRFRQVMQYQRVDRVPLLEEGFRDDVLERWGRQGMPAQGPGGLFNYDRRERIEIDWSLRDVGARGLVGGAELASWRRNLDRPIEDRLGPDWPQRCASWAQRDHLLEFPLHSGLFLTLGVGDWSALESLMYLFFDQRRVVEEAMDLQGELAARVARRVLDQTQVDLVSFSEPIGSNHGPLVSPALYRQLALRSYSGALAAVAQARVPATLFITYANARCLLGDVLAAGFNCLWAMETETSAMDYRDLRREFGKDLRLIGGIDLDSLLAGPDALEREMRDKVPELLAQGGYIPLADGRVRATVSWQAYVHYRRCLENYLSPPSMHAGASDDITGGV